MPREGIEITPELSAILQSKANVLMIEAVAGSGKTTTLSLLTKQACQQGMAPKGIRGLCFSDGAKKRYAQKNKEEGASAGVPLATVEEFAKGCLGRLVHFGYFDAPQPYHSDDDVRPHIVSAAKAVWRKYEETGRRTEFNFAFDDDNSRVEEMADLLFRLKASLTSLHFENEEFDDLDLQYLIDFHDVDREAIEICQEYERRRQPELGYFLWQSAADHVTDLVTLLRRYPQALNAVPRCELYLVDEWHDVNAAEFELIQAIRRGARLIVVGDGDQTINSSRGAEKRFTSSGFENAFPGAKRLPLGKSRRCGPAVAKLASRTTGHPFGSHTDADTSISKVKYDPSVSEDFAKKFAAKVDEVVNARADSSLADIAIIFRESSQSIEIENTLLEEKIAYRIEGFESYLQRPEVLMLRGLLHIACNNYDTLKGDEDTCRRIAAGLSTYCSISQDTRNYHMELSGVRKGTETVLGRAQRDIIENPSILKDFFNGVLCKASASDSISTKSWKSRFKAVVESIETRAKAESAATLLEYIVDALDIRSATRRAFVSRARANSAVRSTRSFIEFARTKGRSLTAAEFLVELKARQEKVKRESGYLSVRKQLTLITIQGAKGQEWPVVMMPYLDDKHFASSADIGLEKRHFYVAITRALDELIMFIPGDDHADQRSLFL
jgi:DNA helicase-2/ATP-dependent DNA helicase PcrA